MLEGKRAYICSPLFAPAQPEVRRNMLKARMYMEQIAVTYHCRTFAPHAYLPELLDDRNPKERGIALSFGMEVLGICDALIICGNRISPGMRREIQEAQESRKDIFQYCRMDRRWVMLSAKKAACL